MRPHLLSTQTFYLNSMGARLLLGGSTGQRLWSPPLCAPARGPASLSLSVCIHKMGLREKTQGDPHPLVSTEEPRRGGHAGGGCCRGEGLGRLHSLRTGWLLLRGAGPWVGRWPCGGGQDAHCQARESGAGALCSQREAGGNLGELPARWDHGRSSHRSGAHLPPRALRARWGKSGKTPWRERASPGPGESHGQACQTVRVEEAVGPGGLGVGQGEQCARAGSRGTPRAQKPESAGGDGGRGVLRRFWPLLLERWRKLKCGTAVG